jgi:hypothetical protein
MLKKRKNKYKDVQDKEINKKCMDMKINKKGTKKCKKYRTKEEEMYGNREIWT